MNPYIPSLLADAVVLLHFLFILFVMAGGMVAIRYRRMMWLHLTAVAWAAVVSFTGWICPLTLIENWLRTQTGQSEYAGSFISRYIEPIIYPSGLTRSHQILLGMAVLIVNGWIYRQVFRTGARGSK